MPFQPDQMSPESLRRLVKLQRRALTKVLGQNVPQHQAQEIVAQTLGHASWRDALARVQTTALGKANASILPLSSLPPSDSEGLDRLLIKCAPVVDGEPDPQVVDFLRHAVRGGMQDVADDLNVRHFRDLLAKAPEDFDLQWASFSLPPMAEVTSDRLIEVFHRLLEKPTRLEAFSNHVQWVEFCKRVRKDPNLRAHREALLEKAWEVPSVFKQAVPLISTDQVWSWLNRAARSRQISIMESIYACHERDIGSYPFHSLQSAAFVGDGHRVEFLIDAHRRRYGLPAEDQAMRSKRFRSPR